MDKPKRKSLRSEIWFNDMTEPGETAVYLERYPNYGITREDWNKLGNYNSQGDRRWDGTLTESVRARKK